MLGPKQLIMRYPLYEYYINSDLSLLDIVNHFGNRFYLQKYSRDKANKVLDKALSLKKLEYVYETTINERVAPTVVDMLVTINCSLWFGVQSNSTQAFAAIALMLKWHYDVNVHYDIVSYREVRDRAIYAFRRLQIYAEMTEEEFKRGPE